MADFAPLNHCIWDLIRTRRDCGQSLLRSMKEWMLIGEQTLWAVPTVTEAMPGPGRERWI